MIELALDGQALDVPQDIDVALTYGVKDIENPMESTVSFSKNIDLPITERNSAIFRHDDELLSAEFFNNSNHTLTVAIDGVEVITGKAFIDDISVVRDSNGAVCGGTYSVAVVGNEIEWAAAAKDKKLCELSDVKVSEFARWSLLPEEKRSKIFFGLADRAAFYNKIGDKIEPRQTVYTADLIPFVNVLYVLQCICTGYTIESSMLQRLANMWVTGRFKDPADERIITDDNKCSAKTSLLAANQETGRLTITVGNDDYYGARVFDTIDDNETGRLSLSSGIVTFTPTKKINATFDVHVHYFTSIIESTAQAVASYADTVMLNYNVLAQLSFKDSLNWRQKILYDGKFPLYINDYNKKLSAVIFESPQYFTEIIQTQIRVYDPDVGKLEEYVTKCTKIEKEVFGIVLSIGDRNNRVALKLKSDPTAPNWKYCVCPNGYVGVFNSDWEWGPSSYRYDLGKVNIYLIPCDNAIISGNYLEFDAEVKSQGYTIDPTAESFDFEVGFAASQRGNLQTDIIATIAADWRIEPNFKGVIPFGQTVSLNDVIGEDKASDFISALRKMFNLTFYTNNAAKKVYIEPYSSFGTDDVIDWTDRLDTSQEIVIVDAGNDAGPTITLGYQSDNDVVDEYNKRAATPVGQYSAQLSNKRNSEPTEIKVDLFNPAMVEQAKTVFPNSSDGATLIKLAESKSGETITDIDYDIDWVVAYKSPEVAYDTIGCDGLFANYRQPRLLFSGTDGNLSFADDAKYNEGLHQYYDDMIDVYRRGKIITCYCKVLPQELASIREPNSSFMDLRAMYKLRIGNEDIMCRLQGITDYNVANASHKCTFVTTLK